MSITAETIYEPVAPPAGIPYRYGLFSVVEFGPHEGLSELGITWESQAAATAGQTNDLCVEPGATPYSTGDYCSVALAKPFTVYIYDTDSRGGSSDAMHQQRAAERFDVAEQHGVEAALAAKLATAVPAPTVVALGTEPSEKLRVALAEVERDLADLTGNEGVIWMSRYAATILNLPVQGGTLRAPLGTRVAALGGGDLATTIYGTGPIKAMRGPLEPPQVSTGRESTNDVDIIAQRTYIIGWDVGAVGASTTLS